MQVNPNYQQREQPPGIRALCEGYAAGILDLFRVNQPDI
jgi:hypothetical protein